MRHIRLLISYRYLLWMWTLREIKVRYKQSILGAAWAILQPLSLMLIFTLVFSFFVRVPTDGIPYPIFAYTALLPWTFFVTSISFGVPSLVNNMNLITKIYFPKEILPVSSLCAGLVDFMLGFLIFIFLVIFYRISLSGYLLWLPVIISIQILLTLGITLLAAAVNVFYRDIRFVVPLALQLWLYLTPIIYPMSIVPAWLRPFYILNPMAGIIDSYRRVLLLAQPPSTFYLGTATLIALSLAILAYSYFKRVEWQFPDVI